MCTAHASRRYIVTLFFGGPRVSVRTTGAARLRYRICRWVVDHRIHASRMRAPWTNSMLATPLWRHADRSTSAGFIVEVTGGTLGLPPPFTTNRQQPPIELKTSS